MKVFISQSGDRSKALALVLEALVRRLIPGADPWVSDTGIDKGSRSMTEIAMSLAEAGGGIICLTSENLTAPWILFEAGALSRHPGDRVWTVLLDIDNAQVDRPLGQFQHTTVEKEDLYRLFVSMNKAGGNPRREEDLRFLFDAAWDKEAASKIQSIRAASSDGGSVNRSTGDMLSEVLEILRAMQRLGGRDEKTLRLVGKIYERVLREPVPSLAELREGWQKPTPAGGGIPRTVSGEINTQGESLDSLLDRLSKIADSLERTDASKTGSDERGSGRQQGAAL